MAEEDRDITWHIWSPPPNETLVGSVKFPQNMLEVQHFVQFYRRETGACPPSPFAIKVGLAVLDFVVNSLNYAICSLLLLLFAYSGSIECELDTLKAFCFIVLLLYFASLHWSTVTYKTSQRRMFLAVIFVELNFRCHITFWLRNQSGWWRQFAAILHLAPVLHCPSEGAIRTEFGLAEPR